MCNAADILIDNTWTVKYWSKLKGYWIYIETEFLFFRYNVGSFRFGHSETVGPLYAVWGLFNDSVPLRADNFQSQANRKWKSSEILPMSANLLFILYKSDNDTVTPNYVVKTYVNFELQIVPACGGTVCPYDTIKSALNSYLGDNCKYKDMCTIKKDTNTTSSSTIVSLSVGMLVFTLILTVLHI